MAIEIEIAPAEPAVGDGITVTVRGEVPEGSQVTITSSGDQLAASPPFGQGLVPEGTGDEAVSLQMYGGTFGTFTLSVRDPDIVPPDDAVYYVTDPIYYEEDAPVYAFPDVDEVVEALLDAVPDGVEVSADRFGNTLTILFGGLWASKNIETTISASIGGSETATVADVTTTGGPFVAGPFYLEEGTYDVDVVDDEGNSLLGGETAEVEVTA